MQGFRGQEGLDERRGLFSRDGGLRPSKFPGRPLT